MTYTISESTKELNIKEIIFRPQLIHNEHITNFENKHGKELVEEVEKALDIVYDNFHHFKKLESANKFHSLILLSDGITTLINVFHSYFIGYAIEGFVLLRYYIECIGLSYGIFIDESLFKEWSQNLKNKNANYFTKKGLKFLYSKYPDIEGIWNEFSKISHLEYTSTRSTYLSENILTVGGAHTKERRAMNTTLIESSELMLKMTNLIFGEDLNLFKSK